MLESLHPVQDVPNSAEFLNELRNGRNLGLPPRLLMPDRAGFRNGSPDQVTCAGDAPLLSCHFYRKPRSMKGRIRVGRPVSRARVEFGLPRVLIGIAQTRD